MGSGVESSSFVVFFVVVFLGGGGGGCVGPAAVDDVVDLVLPVAPRVTEQGDDGGSRLGVRRLDATPLP